MVFAEPEAAVNCLGEDSRCDQPEHWGKGASLSCACSHDVIQKGVVSTHSWWSESVQVSYHMEGFVSSLCKSSRLISISSCDIVTNADASSGSSHVMDGPNSMQEIQWYLGLGTRRQLEPWSRDFYP